jgi:hypothetical protein
MNPTKCPKNNRKAFIDRRQNEVNRMENNILERRKSLFDRRVILQQQGKKTDNPLLIYKSLFWKGIRN